VTEHSSEWTPSADLPAPDSDAASGDDQAAPDVATMSFELALAELERIVQDLERGQLDLDAAIHAYERGTRLKTHCEAKLREAQLRVEQISLGADGKARATPTDLE
jgi:exodeoxyribonuclease VII small subunit